MDQLVEIPVHTSLLAFDGRVLEAFGPDVAPATRLHIRMMARWWIDGSMLCIMSPRNGLTAWPFDPPQLAGVQYLLQLLDTAKAGLTPG
jgi:hypothetical protein